MAIKTFTTGEVLTASDTNTYLANAGYVYVKGETFVTATEVLVDSVFTSAFRNYRIVFDCQSSAGGGIFEFQVRGGGSTISTLTYNYTAMDITAGVGTFRASTAQGSIRFGANDASGWNASTLDIFVPALAAPTRLITAFNRNSGATVENTWSANTNSTAYDGFRLSVGTGTMTGTYVLYGCRTA